MLLPPGDWRGSPFTFHGDQTECANATEEIAFTKRRNAELAAEATLGQFSDNRFALGVLG
eukprot:4332810-Pyramimonas_sp.AAC.1